MVSSDFIIVNVVLGVVIIGAAILAFQQTKDLRARDARGDSAVSRTRTRIILAIVAAVLLVIILLLTLVK